MTKAMTRHQARRAKREAIVLVGWKSETHLITIAEIATRLGVCYATAHRMVARGDIPFVYQGRLRRVVREAFNLWEASQTVKMLEGLSDHA
jgi:excisionase family DNA binding protein